MGNRTKGLLLSLLSAVLLILSFPKFNLEFLAWFGFVPVFFALNNKSSKYAFFLFFVTGAIFWSGIIYWLVHVTLAGTIVLVLYLALYFAVFGLAIRASTKHSTPYVLVFIPSVWVLLEYVRSRLFTGFPWALLGYSQYLNLPVMQIADITGVWGVSFLVMMVNVGIVEIIYSGINGLMPRLKITAVLLVSFLFLTLSYGYFRLSQGEAAMNPRHPIRISLIQGNIPQEMKWNPGAEDFIINKYITLTTESLKDKPDLIVWPEAASPAILGEDNASFARIFDLARQIKTPLLLGAVVRERRDYFNSAILLGTEGRIAGRYNKLHLVPFGEYIPLKKMFPFLETVVPIGDIARGTDYTIFEIPGSKPQTPAKFAVLICFEDLFPELSREFLRKGAAFLVNITNDAWYKRTSAPYQHLQASVFRAVENRVFLVRAANTGVSGFIAPTGRIISLVGDEFGADIFISGYKSGDISPQSGQKPSFYTRYGNISVAACALFVLAGMAVFIKRP